MISEPNESMPTITGAIISFCQSLCLALQASTGGLQLAAMLEAGQFERAHDGRQQTNEKNIDKRNYTSRAANSRYIPATLAAAAAISVRSGAHQLANLAVSALVARPLSLHAQSSNGDQAAALAARLLPLCIN